MDLRFLKSWMGTRGANVLVDGGIVGQRRDEQTGREDQAGRWKDWSQHSEIGSGTGSFRGFPMQSAEAQDSTVNLQGLSKQ